MESVSETPTTLSSLSPVLPSQRPVLPRFRTQRFQERLTKTTTWETRMTGIDHDKQANETNRMLRDSRNFWKWLAFVSWISVALGAMLRMFPLH